MKRVLTGMAVMLCLASPAAVSARQTGASPQAAPQAPVQQPGARRMRMRMRMMRRMMMRRRGAQMMRRLNLSEQQIASIRSIRQNAFKGTQAQREELRQLFAARRQSGGQLTPEQQARAKQLREDLRAAHKSARDQILGVLTPEQRAQLDQLRQERKARREQFRQRREELRQQRTQTRDGVK